MKRAAMEKLIEWKDNPQRQPLILRGARQVGKTWLMKEFDQSKFKKYAYINFDQNQRMKQLNLKTKIYIYKKSDALLFL